MVGEDVAQVVLVRLCDENQWHVGRWNRVGTLGSACKLLVDLTLGDGVTIIFVLN